MTEVQKERTREEIFLGALHGAFVGGRIGALRRWHPGDYDPAVVSVTFGAEYDEQDPWAMTGKLFVLVNSGSRTPRYGYPGTGIGQWARGFGYDNVAVERTLNALCRAQSFAQIDRELTALGQAGGGRVIPHWATVLDELTRWNDPEQRRRVQFDWAKGFYTYVPRKSDSTAAAATD